MTHGIQFNRLVIKNFLSFGANPTVIDLRGNRITVVLGLNHDTGGDESRNGVGKSAMIDAISYAIFGKSIRGISNQKLINKMMKKGQGMLVVLEFDTPEGSFRIERGEAPSKLKLYRKDLDDTNDFLLRDGKSFVYDISQNKNQTLSEIERLIGFDIKLFEFLIANTSETEPFMKLPEDKKREIAERLMGLNLLTERAEELKEDRKEKKKDLISAESSLEATQQANRRIEQQIQDLKSREETWLKQHNDEIDKLKKKIEELQSVNIDEQIEIFELIEELDAQDNTVQSSIKQTQLELRQANRDLDDLNKRIEVSGDRFKELGNQKKKIDDSECPTCGQHWVADKSIIIAIEEEINELSDFSVDAVELLTIAEENVDKFKNILDGLNKEADEITKTATEISDFDLYFDSIAEASKAATLIETHKETVSRMEKEENPHTETIHGLQHKAIKEVNDDEVKNLSTMIDHYNYLIDLLQSKDSFLRKAVIDRWLPKLNGRIAHYLSTLELPYTVRIENDLTMTIKDFGEDFDWGNLSKGQRQRVTIALNLAFQDLFEATNQPLSLLMVDELIDSGICNRGASQAVQALHEICEKKDKRVFLITHRMDVADQIDDVMLVELKNKISRIEDDEDDME